MHRRSTALTTVTALALAGFAAAAPSEAAAPAASRAVVTNHLISPLTAAVRANGTAFVSQNFAGSLVRHKPGGRNKVVYQAAKNTEVGGVSVGNGEVTFTLTRGSGEEMAASHSSVMHRSTSGKVTKFADTGRFERTQNPDGDVTYGFRNLAKKCRAKLPPDIPGKNGKYTGVIDTHPYGTAVDGGTTYVADAAGNDVLSIDSSGDISLVTVLKPVPLKVTKARAKASHLPACTIGHRYWFEPVPTDVEVRDDGNLVVSTLTGATEVPGFGGQSRVYRVDPVTGDATRLASRLDGAVGVALAPSGAIYVSQLDGNVVSKIPAGGGAPTTFKKVFQPAAVERVGGRVYVTSNVLAQKPAGRLLRFGH